MGIKVQHPKSMMGRSLKDGSTSHTHSTNTKHQMHKDQWDQGVWKSHHSSIFLCPGFYTALCIPELSSTTGNIHGTAIKLKIPARKTILNSSSDITLVNTKSRRNYSTSQPDFQHKRDEGVPPPPIPNDTDKETEKNAKNPKIFPSSEGNLHRVRKSRELSR